MLIKRASLRKTMFSSRRLQVLCIASSVMIASNVYGDSNLANQRFLDNAIQYDANEGLKSHSDTLRQLSAEQLDPGVEVVRDASSDWVEVKSSKKKAKGGFSFSDMAKSSRGKSQSSGLSFGEMARSTRKPKPILMLKNRSETVTKSIQINLK